MAEPSSNGIVVLRSACPFAETVERIAATLERHGVTIFATIDHRAAAASVGLAMPPTTVILFGNPAVGTPLMIARPSIALDLPSRVLVAEDASGAVTASFNAWRQLAARHALPADLAERLSPLERLLADAIA